MAAILRILFGLASVLLMLGGIGIIIFSPIYGIKLSGVPCFFAGLTLFPPVIQTLNERFMPESKLALSYVLALLLAFILLATCFLVVKANVERGYQTETQPREFEFGSQDLVVDQSVGDQALSDLSDDEWAALYDEARQKPEITQVQFVNAEAYLDALDNDTTPIQVTSADMIGCDTDTSAIALVDSLKTENWSRFKSLMRSGCTQMPPNLKMDTMGYPADGVVSFKVHDMPAPGIFWLPTTEQPGSDEPVEFWQIK